MDTFSQRLQRALTLRGMKPADLVARKVLSKAGIYFLLDGTTKPDKIREETVTKLCEALSVNREWLLHGKGPIEGDDDRRDPEWSDVLGYKAVITFPIIDNMTGKEVAHWKFNKLEVK